jgi:hypothetical protein
MWKRKILDHLLNVKLADLPFMDDAKVTSIKEKCSSISSYRKAMGQPYFDQQGAFRSAPSTSDNQWRGAVGELGEKFLRFLEEVCFQQQFDGTLKLALLHGKSIADTFELEAMAERWSEIETRAKVPLRNPPLEEEGDRVVAESFMPDNVIIPDISQNILPLTESAKETIADAVKEAQRHVNQGVMLIDASEKESAIKEQLTRHHISNISGNSSSYVLVVYDVKASGEDHRFSTSAKSPPLRKSQAGHQAITNIRR